MSEREAGVRLTANGGWTLSDFGKLLNCIADCNAAGGVGALVSADDQATWFRTLKKPAFNPPGLVFAPVWTLLYTLMGISAFLVWRERDRGADRAISDRTLRLFAIQLTLNALWTFLFFEFRSPRFSFLNIIVLLGAIALTIQAMWGISRSAALLMLPHLLWVGFATVLNGTIWRLNR